MILSQTAEYALRAAAWLAAHPDETPIRSRDLSEQTGIPGPYLAKILRRLVVAGVLESRKGVGGGFELARAPSEIPFVQVLAAVDAYTGEGRCVFGWGQCDASHPCPLHPAWVRMSDAFRSWASTTTLADVS
jgi:Rrf2 family protein